MTDTVSVHIEYELVTCSTCDAIRQCYSVRHLPIQPHNQSRYQKTEISCSPLDSEEDAQSNLPPFLMVRSTALEACIQQEAWR